MRRIHETIQSWSAVHAGFLSEGATWLRTCELFASVWGEPKLLARVFCCRWQTYPVTVDSSVSVDKQAVFPGKQSERQEDVVLSNVTVLRSKRSDVTGSEARTSQFVRRRFQSQERTWMNTNLLVFPFFFWLQNNYPTPFFLSLTLLFLSLSPPHHIIFLTLAILFFLPLPRARAMSCQYSLRCHKNKGWLIQDGRMKREMKWWWRGGWKSAAVHSSCQSLV